MNKIIISYLVFIGLVSCTSDKSTNSFSKKETIERAEQTLAALYNSYSIENSNLLRENYPFDENYLATYLASEEIEEAPRLYSFLWPYSGTLSAVNALIEATNSKNHKELLEKRVLTGLEEYIDSERHPEAYASYVNTESASDRFYDDNIWIGIDFIDLYQQQKDPYYLEKSKNIWSFIESGKDEKLGGGIYWCEQQKVGKNTCSNAPAVVYALKLFEATGDSSYFYTGKSLYNWTKEHLQDKKDHLYYDHITLDGNIGEAKFSYNSGQMLQAAVMLYRLTNNETYLLEAKAIAEASYNQFFQDFITDQNSKIRLLKSGDIWFSAIMFRGFLELYKVDKEEKYMNAFSQSLDHAWANARDDRGLFSTDWSGQKQDSTKWLLTQAAMIEMYARLGTVK